MVVLVKWRRLRSWSQADVGRRLGGLAQPVISTHESSKGTPTLETLQRYASLYGVSLDELLAGPTMVGQWATRG